MKTRRRFGSRENETVFMLVALFLAPGCSTSAPPADGGPTGGALGGIAAGGRAGSAASGGAAAGDAGPAAIGGAGGLAAGGGGSDGRDAEDVRGGELGAGDASELGDAPARLTCGEGAAMLPSGGEVGGLVVAPDGSIFFTHGLSGGPIVRVRPGRAPESIPVYIEPSATGITYDPVRDALYVAVFFSKKIMRIDLGTATPKAVAVAQGGAGVDGVTLGEDGNIYFSDHVLGTIWRTGPTGGQIGVTASALPGGPTGLAFGKDGKLYVSQSSGTDVVRLTLDGQGHETARETFVSLGAKGGSGLAFDEAGDLYVAAEKLFRVDPAGKIVAITPRAAAALDFGAGALRCADLYLGGSDGLRVQTGARKGLDVPWHRRP